LKDGKEVNHSISQLKKRAISTGSIPEATQPILQIFLGFNHQAGSEDPSWIIVPHFSKIKQSTAELLWLDHFKSGCCPPSWISSEVHLNHSAASV